MIPLSKKFWKARWREGEGEEGLVLRGQITSGPGLTAAWLSARVEPEIVSCGDSLHANPSDGRTALTTKLTIKERGHLRTVRSRHYALVCAGPSNYYYYYYYLICFTKYA